TLHLFEPDSYERISSDKHKHLILDGCVRLDPHEGTPDARLLRIRERLAEELQRSGLDFYQPALKSQWMATATQEDDADDDEPAKVWIEKTLVQGRADRLAGEHSLGKALWSPQRA